MSLRWNQRGVAYWTDGTSERVFWGTGNGYLLSVDAKTGLPSPDFGEHGRIDLMQGLPRARRGERDYLNALTYSVQSPPLVVGDIVIAPASISSLVNKKEQIPGWIRAYDVRTGALRWTFKTVPAAGDYGYETWQRGTAEVSGKVTVWTTMSADEELGYIYLPTNTTAPDFYGGHRPGDNLFAESILCLDAKTGERVWHFQTVHHGLWDYDNPAAPNLLDITVDGRRIKALAQVTKQGFVYTFDRVTGKPVWPIEERPVPPSPIPGEVASKTQPFPNPTSAIRGARGNARRPRRLHAGAPCACDRSRQGLHAGAALHSAHDERHHHAAVHRRRCELGWRGRRSGDGDAVCALPKRIWCQSCCPAGSEVEQQPALHANADTQPADAAGAAALQTPILADDRHRHEHR